MEKKGTAQTTNIVLAVIVIVILAFLGVSWSKYRGQNATENSTTTETATTETTGANETDLTRVITYEGVGGQDAFTLLQENVSDVEYSESDFGVFVTGIDGVTAPEGYFWALYVNDEFAQVGASELITKDGDQVKWQLDAIQY